MGPRPGYFLCKLLFTWVAILGAVAAAAHWQHVWLAVAVVLFVATRQNVLALLLHEQVHGLGIRGRFGDALCNAVIAYPLLITLEGYRRVHLAHHRHYFTERDPDYVRKQGEAWTFPQRARRLVRLLLLDATGLLAWRLRNSKSADPPPGPGGLARALYYAAVVLVLLLTHGWVPALLYWLLPLLTVFQAIIRWAAICEHKYDLINPTVAESTPFIKLRWWESLLLPDLNFHTYHIYHHWYPAVPYSRLGHVHQIFRREGLVKEENVFQG